MACQTKSHYPYDQYVFNDDIYPLYGQATRPRPEVISLVCAFCEEEILVKDCI